MWKPERSGLPPLPSTLHWRQCMWLEAHTWYVTDLAVSLVFAPYGLRSVSESCKFAHCGPLNGANGKWLKGTRRRTRRPHLGAVNIGWLRKNGQVHAKNIAYTGTHAELPNCCPKLFSISHLAYNINSQESSEPTSAFSSSKPFLTFVQFF